MLYGLQQGFEQWKIRARCGYADCGDISYVCNATGKLFPMGYRDGDTPVTAIVSSETVGDYTLFVTRPMK